jgi:hypothetical protein
MLSWYGPRIGRSLRELSALLDSARRRRLSGGDDR